MIIMVGLLSFYTLSAYRSTPEKINFCEAIAYFFPSGMNVPSRHGHGLLSQPMGWDWLA